MKTMIAALSLLSVSLSGSAPASVRLSPGSPAKVLFDCEVTSLLDDDFSGSLGGRRHSSVRVLDNHNVITVEIGANSYEDGKGYTIKAGAHFNSKNAFDYRITAVNPKDDSFEVYNDDNGGTVSVYSKTRNRNIALISCE